MKVFDVWKFVSILFSCRQKWIIFSPPLFLCALLLSLSKRRTLSLQNKVIGHVMELSGGGWFFFIAREPVEGRDAYVTNQCNESDFFL